MKKIWMMLLVGVFFLAACKDKSQPTAVEDGKAYYGEKISDEGVISYDELLKKLETEESVENVKVKGKIDGVCKVKGCWMNIVSETDASKDPIFVKFKDYGFFMPLDASGTVIMQGRAYKEETSVEELRHYAEDEGKSPEEIAKITEPITELKFMADGVIHL